MSILILLLQVMAAKLATELKPDTGRARELCLVTNGGKYGGYRQDILTENLTERELTFLTCDLCQGVMREACLSSNGEQFCFSCQKENTGKRRMMNQTNPNLHVRKTVSLLKCACPLLDRGCRWIGKLEDCEKHLDGCTYVYEVCVCYNVVLYYPVITMHLIGETNVYIVSLNVSIARLVFNFVIWQITMVNAQR